MKKLLFPILILLLACTVQAAFDESDIQEKMDKYQEDSFGLPDRANDLLEGKQINLLVSGKTVGVQIGNGKIAATQDGGYPDTAFDVTTDYETLDAVNRKKISFGYALDSGAVDVEANGLVNKVVLFLLKQALGLFLDLEVDYDLQNVPCVIAPNGEALDIAVSASEMDVSMPGGYDLAVEPFGITCTPGENLELTLNIPSNMKNVQGVICKGGVCGQVVVERTEKLLCGDAVVEEQRKETVLMPNLFPVKLSERKGIKRVEQANFKVEVVDGQQALTMGSPKEEVLQPSNKNLKIITTPLNVLLTNPGATVKVTMPLVSDPEIDGRSSFFILHLFFGNYAIYPLKILL